MGRFRKDLGDLTSLIESIKEIGLIHPVVVDSEGTLIAGQRRLEACKMAGVNPVYRVVDFNDPVKAELHENTIRKDFLPSEIAAIAEYLERTESRQGNNQYTEKSFGTNDTEAKQPRDKVSELTGKGTMTISKINRIFKSADERLKKAVDSGSISVNKAYAKLRRTEEKKEAAEKGKDIIIDAIDFRHGDFMEVFQNIPDNSIDCIITDPPYPEKFLDQWTNLGIFAKRVLKENGFCIAYSGQMHLPEVLERMNYSLDYYWTFAVYHEGQTQIVNGVNLICRWKPVLIFQNGRKKLNNTIQDYFISKRPEKTGHIWQQSESGMEYIIEMFTNAGDTIIDPFSGSGTTLVVGSRMNRIMIGAEIEKETYNVAKTRIWQQGKS